MLNSHVCIADSIVTEHEGRLVALVHFNREEIEAMIDDWREEWATYKEAWEAKTEQLKKEILDFVNAKVNRFSRIWEVVEEKEAFIKTPTHKIKRFLYSKRGKGADPAVKAGAGLPRYETRGESLIRVSTGITGRDVAYRPFFSAAAGSGDAGILEIWLRSTWQPGPVRALIPVSRTPGISPIRTKHIQKRISDRISFFLVSERNSPSRGTGPPAGRRCRLPTDAPHVGNSRSGAPLAGHFGRSLLRNLLELVLPTPQSGHTQSSGISSKAVPGGDAAFGITYFGVVDPVTYRATILFHFFVFFS